MRLHYPNIGSVGILIVFVTTDLLNYWIVFEMVVTSYTHASFSCFWRWFAKYGWLILLVSPIRSWFYSTRFWALSHHATPEIWVWGSRHHQAASQKQKDATPASWTSTSRSTRIILTFIGRSLSCSHSCHSVSHLARTGSNLCYGKAWNCIDLSGLFLNS